MPGWHERTAELQADGSLQLVGIVLEQHPERAKLFMQWKEMKWPVMVDAVNEMELTAVPITLLIDEAGNVFSMDPRRDLDTFLAAGPVAFAPAETAMAPDVAALRAAVSSSTGAEARCAAEIALGDALLRFGGAASIDDAIAAYERAAATGIDARGALDFRLGVAARRRFETPPHDPAQFERAITSWRAALAQNPNQYIWRRRIQQYGPRLDKPYPFYDWVPTAREAVVARGGTPVALPIEPTGAEYARPQRDVPASIADAERNAEHAAIERDDGRVAVRGVFVPTTSRRGPQGGRLHVLFTPNPLREGHWNHEAEPMYVRLERPDGWSLARNEFTIPNGTTATSTETRSIDLELAPDPEAAVRARALRGYALFNVCEGPTGVCLYRRLDFEIEIAP